jgi:LuxR family maltose regulon positive regulatory protein
MGLVPTTIIPPRATPQLIARAGQGKLTDAIDQSRVTTICAPAGSGKTTAALSWFRQLQERGRPGLWLAARAGIRDLPSFLVALQAAGIAAGLDWAGLDPEGPDAPWLASLAEPRAAKPVLVVDDAQLLPAPALEFLATR